MVLFPRILVLGMGMLQAGCCILSVANVYSANTNTIFGLLIIINLYTAITVGRPMCTQKFGERIFKHVHIEGFLTIPNTAIKKGIPMVHARIHSNIQHVYTGYNNTGHAGLGMPS